MTAQIVCRKGDTSFSRKYSSETIQFRKILLINALTTSICNYNIQISSPCFFFVRIFGMKENLVDTLGGGGVAHSV